MATIQEQINSGLCQQNEAYGAETSKTCISQITATLSIITTGVNDVFDKSLDFRTELSRLMASGSTDIFRGVNTFEENGGDDVTETLEDGTEFLTNEAKYKFLAGFANGTAFQKALNSVSGFKNKRVLLITKDGVWGTQDADGNLIGFTTGMIQKAKLTFGTFSSTEKQGLMFQFLERDELDSKFAFIPNKDAKNYLGVTQVALKMVNAPSDTDTTITVQAVYAQNASDVVAGFEYSQFNQKINGATSNPTAGDDSTTTGTYVLTVAALATGEKGELSLYDNTNNTPVVVGLDGDFYRSSAVTYTIV